MCMSQLQEWVQDRLRQTRSFGPFRDDKSQLRCSNQDSCLGRSRIPCPGLLSSSGSLTSSTVAPVMLRKCTNEVGSEHLGRKLSALFIVGNLTSVMASVVPSIKHEDNSGSSLNGRNSTEVKSHSSKNTWQHVVCPPDRSNPTAPSPSFAARASSPPQRQPPDPTPARCS